MSELVKVLFYARKSKKNKHGKVPVYLRVTICGQRFEVTTGRYITESEWSPLSGRALGYTSEAKEMNNYLSSLQTKAFDIQKRTIASGRKLTAEEFEKQWRGEGEEQHMLLEIFEQHNNQIYELVDKQYAHATLKKYDTILSHTKNFINETYSVQDVPLKELKYKFITDFEFWLKAKKNCSHNSTIKYLTLFKKIVRICIKNGWLERDPFYGFSMTKQEVERSYLSAFELETMAAKDFLLDRLNQVRDIFLFSCYTGLAYADVLKLRRRDIVIGVDGERWISTRRQKTDSLSKIPILPQAQVILDNYSDHPQCIIKGRLLPVLSNQKTNAYLKEIADLCGIEKLLTFHMARHTFATTITLTNGVPIETVGKMLGHRNLKTTQHYAKIIDKKVSEDMLALRNRLENKPILN